MDAESAHTHTHTHDTSRHTHAVIRVEREQTWQISGGFHTFLYHSRTCLSFSLPNYRVEEKEGSSRGERGRERGMGQGEGETTGSGVQEQLGFK